MTTYSHDYVQLEIRSDALMDLINNGDLVIEDVRALNKHSREGVRSMLLAAIKNLSSA